MFVEEGDDDAEEDKTPLRKGTRKDDECSKHKQQGFAPASQLPRHTACAGGDWYSLAGHRRQCEPGGPGGGRRGARGWRHAGVGPRRVVDDDDGQIVKWSCEARRLVERRRMR